MPNKSSSKALSGEYRGYDSAGIALLNKGLNVYKRRVKFKELEEYLKGKDLTSTIGIGHTRWSYARRAKRCECPPRITHHPKLAIIHNGIIENYSSLKQEPDQQRSFLHKRNRYRGSDSFYRDIQENNQCPLDEAVRLALTKVVGAYAIVIMSLEDPDLLIVARKGSPLVIGVGKDEYFIASDATPIIEYTNEVVYLNDFEIAVINDGKLKIKPLRDAPMTPWHQKLEMELEAIEKGGFDHFMLKRNLWATPIY